MDNASAFFAPRQTPKLQESRSEPYFSCELKLINIGFDSKLDGELYAGIRLGLAVGLLMNGDARAAVAGHEARLERPAEKSRIVVHNLLWQCDERRCIAAGQSESRPVIVCMALARELGPVLDFTTGGKALDAAGLVRCNAPHDEKASVSSR